MHPAAGDPAAVLQKYYNYYCECKYHHIPEAKPNDLEDPENHDVNIFSIMFERAFDF